MSKSSPPASPGPVAPAAAPRIRLQKFLASCGLGSRRACEEFVTSGRVTIDGETVSQLGASVDPSQQEVRLDGELLKIERKKYYALNKPRGVVCTNRDPAGRPRVIDLFPPEGPRLFPVGRLDEESEGLIIVTNDGDLSQKLAHPKFRIFRTYHAHVAGVPNRPALEELKRGHHFAEGKFRVHSARLIKKQGQSSFVEIVLTEGQNREVRRLLARIGHKVMRLKRVSFGPIQLGRLKRGEFRELTYGELAELHGILERNIRTPRATPPADSPPANSPPVATEALSGKSPVRRKRSPGGNRPPHERFERREKPRRGAGRSR